ncbi:MAG TPA: heme exporter protein CcmD [Caulobacteraceae bacterium]
MSQLLVHAGKYAVFIWPAYGVSAAAFAWMILDTALRTRRWRRRARELEGTRGG